MALPKISASNASATEVRCDALLVPALQVGKKFELPKVAQEIDAALDGRIREHLDATGFTAKPGSVAMVASGEKLAARSVAVAGIGSRSELSTWTLRRVGGGVARRLSSSSTIASLLHCELQDGEGIAASIEGLALGNYRTTNFKTKPASTSTESIVVLDASRDDVARGQAIVQAVALARDLTN
ncbi:MAG TPA: M17 family peptidase N-terminal domain-containing protein, partial [Actinomycetota bacterium]|nr:M17 family peptidase N-terminal domain-containing protein [Actinomycetota bacterium]